MKHIKYRILMLSLLIFLSGNITNAQTQYGWRGPFQSGNYNESGLLKIWPASGPALLWESTDVGTGYSSVTVTPDAVYITGRKGNNDVLTAFTRDGKKMWELIYGKASDSNFPDSRCTPSVINGKILLVSGMGDMVCVSKDGKIVWSVDYFDKYSGKIPQFGVSESPLLVGNLVIGTPGGKKHLWWHSILITEMLFGKLHR